MVPSVATRRFSIPDPPILEAVADRQKVYLIKEVAVNKNVVIEGHPDIGMTDSFLPFGEHGVLRLTYKLIQFSLSSTKEDPSHSKIAKI